MKVLHLSAPTSLAGAERVILNYLENRDRGAFSVHIASLLNHCRLDNSFTDVLAEMDLVCFKIPIGNTGLLWQIREVARIIRENGIDILHTHGYRADITGFIASRMAGIPVVATVHGWTPISLKLSCYEKLDRFFLKRFNTIHCVSRQLYDEFKRIVSDGQRLAYLPNAVPSLKMPIKQRVVARKHLNFPEEGIAILSVGRLSPEKGLDLLLEAFAVLCRNDDNICLVIVGDGPLKEALTSQVRQLGIESRVIFTGFLRNVDDWYAAADLFVLSSHTEGLPMVLLEAMATGLPVVTTAVGGIPDIICNGENGMLVPAGDVGAIVSAIGMSIKDTALRGRLSANARKTVETSFSVDKWVHDLEGIYQCVYKTWKERT